MLNITVFFFKEMQVGILWTLMFKLKEINMFTQVNNAFQLAQ